MTLEMRRELVAYLRQVIAPLLDEPDRASLRVSMDRLKVTITANPRATSLLIGTRFRMADALRLLARTKSRSMGWRGESVDLRVERNSGRG